MQILRDYLTTVEIRPNRRIAILRHQSKGSRRPVGRVLLVHGACARMQQLVFVIRNLVEKGYEVVSYDALGCGASDKPIITSAYSSREMFSDLVALIKRYGPEENKWVSLMGHSIGGAMLAKFAATAECEQFTDSVICITPPVISASATSSTGIFKLPGSILWLIRPWMGVKARQMLFGPKATASLRNMEREASARNPVYMFKAFYTSIDRSFLAVSESSFHVPVLCIGAEYDKVCPALAVEEMSKRCKCKYVLAKDCGHQCMQEDPEQINGIIETFLKTLE